MPYLLDTCIVSAYFRGEKSVIDKFKSLSPEDIKISTITIMEIEYGLEINPPIKTKIHPIWSAFKDQVETLSFSARDALHSAQIRGVLKKEGKPIGPYDILLAGLSRNRNLIFVTDKTSEFKRVPNLVIENWLPNKP
jgi:tRNA(fMet)-specific endonuclease VapC